MANPLKCSVCDAVATVHLTQIVQGKVTKVDFCEACAAKGGAGDAAVFKLADAVNAATPAPAITCPECGFTDVEFRRRLFDLRFKHYTGQLVNTADLKATRRGIARIQTIIRERALLQGSAE